MTQLFHEDAACSVHAGSHGYSNIYYGPATLVHRFHQSVKHNDLKTKSKKWFLESKVIYNAFCQAHDIPYA